ncbi:unnamed protein product [Dovyalis caffra]|uniref:Uncharacterized protein n=1 Tax=Dovyalis caffra TaxID=77055 RepID=A0AAV1RPE8_9ROSI|nr:unnamed protein product [Dovyalis caffra]
MVLQPLALCRLCKEIPAMPHGKTWQLKDSNVHGIRTPSVGVGPENDEIVTYDEILNFNKENVANVAYDTETVSTCWDSGTNWIGYDGFESTVGKVNFARDQGLLVVDMSRGIGKTKRLRVEIHQPLGNQKAPNFPIQ